MREEESMGKEENISCANCDSPLENDLRFCRFCGTKIGIPEDIPEDEITVQTIPCNSCGEHIESSARFCSNCGNSVNKTSDEPESPDAIPEEKITVQTIPCNSCGEQIESSLVFCTSCGVKISQSPDTERPSITEQKGIPNPEESSAPQQSENPEDPNRPVRHVETEPLGPSSKQSWEININWSDTWKTLYSEHAMTSILGLGILLVTVGSLVLLVSMWENENNRIFLIPMSAGQAIAFIAVGHMVKEKMGLRLSGLAFITIAAVWSLFTSGVIAYLLTDPITDHPQLPGIELKLHIAPWAWLIILAIPLPIWAYLTYRYKGYVLTHGTLLLVGLSLSLLSLVAEPNWDSWKWNFLPLSLSVPYIAYGALNIHNKINKLILLSTGNVLVSLFVIGTLVVTNEWTKMASLVLGTVYFGIMGIAMNSYLPVLTRKLNPVLPKFKQSIHEIVVPSFFILSALSFVGATSSAILTLDINWQILIAIVGWTATAISIGLMYITRKWYWAYVIAGLAHIGFLASITLDQIELENINHYGLITIPFVATFVVFVAWSYSKFKNPKKMYRELIDERHFPLVSLAIIDIVISIILCGWEKWDNFEGMTAAALFTITLVAASYISKNRFVPYGATILLAVTTMFCVGSIGDGSWTIRAVSWSLQGLISWWAAAGLRKMSVGTLRNYLYIWESPLRLTSTRFAIASGVFVIIALVSSLLEGNEHQAHIINATTVIAVIGLLYLGIGIVEKNALYGYISAASLLLSWYIQAVNLNFSEVHFYAIPAGIYLLGIAYFEYKRASEIKFLALAANALAILILPVSAFIQSLVVSPELLYASLCAVEAIILIGWGLYSRSKIIFVGGLVTLVINLLWHLATTLSDINVAFTAIGFGLLFIGIAVVIERMKNRLAQSRKEWIDQLDTWNW